MSTVWVIQETSHDFSDAERFGDVQFLTRDDLNNMKNSIHNERLMASLRTKLRATDPEDFFLIAGSPYVSAVVFMMLGQMGRFSVKMLRWSNRDRAYFPLPLELRMEKTA